MRHRVELDGAIPPGRFREIVDFFFAGYSERLGLGVYDDELVIEPVTRAHLRQITDTRSMQHRINGAVGRLKRDPKIFGVFLAQDSLIVMMGTLGHELVHVAQELRGDLTDGGDGNVTWKGQRYDNTLLSSGLAMIAPQIAYEAYSSRPWEKEAEERGPAMFLEIFDSLPPDLRLYMAAAN